MLCIDIILVEKDSKYVCRCSEKDETKISYSLKHLEPYTFIKWRRKQNVLMCFGGIVIFM